MPQKKPSLEAEKMIKEDKTFSLLSNCQELTVPTVEEALWRKMDANIKAKDVSWQSTQRKLLKVVTVVARAVD